MRTLISFLLFSALLTSLIACERARLDASSAVLTRPTNSPPEPFFLDPRLPRSLCWEEEADEQKKERLKCWSQRFPDLNCPELHLVEDFSWNASEFLNNNWRRFLPWGMEQDISIVEADGQGALRATRLSRRSVAMTLYENLSGEVALVEMDRWVLNRWIPWLETEPEQRLPMSTAPSFLRCETIPEAGFTI